MLKGVLAKKAGGPDAFAGGAARLKRSMDPHASIRRWSFIEISPGRAGRYTRMAMQGGKAGGYVRRGSEDKGSFLSDWKSSAGYSLSTPKSRLSIDFRSGNAARDRVFSSAERCESGSIGRSRKPLYP